MGGLQTRSELVLRDGIVHRVRYKRSLAHGREYPPEDGGMIGPIAWVEENRPDLLPKIKGYEVHGKDYVPNPRDYTLNQLVDALAEIEDEWIIRAMQANDGRPGVGKIYIERLKQLAEAPKSPAVEESDEDEIESIGMPDEEELSDGRADAPAGEGRAIPA